MPVIPGTEDESARNSSLVRSRLYPRTNYTQYTTERERERLEEEEEEEGEETQCLADLRFFFGLVCVYGFSESDKWRCFSDSYEMV